MKHPAMYMCSVAFPFMLTMVGSVQAAVYPAPLQKNLHEQADFCKDMAGKFGDPSDAIATVDLNHDGKPDYVLNEGKLQCEGAASIYSGAGGTTTVDVYVSTPAGYVTGWSDGAFDAKIEASKVWLTLGGSYCSAHNTNGDMCERALNWLPAKHLMVMEPISKKRPFQDN